MIRNAIAAAFVALLVLLGCRTAGETPHGHGHHDDEHAIEEAARGPHGGRLLRDGNVTVELAIFERGVPPEYRAWVSSDGHEVDPRAVDLVVELDRFGDRTDVVRFREHDGYLRGDRVVDEPHSFLVTVRAEAEGRSHEWRYESFEGRTTIAAESAAKSGIEVETAGPARIEERLPAVGRVTPNLEALVRIVPPYPGTVREAERSVGDVVAKGERLAVIEASQTLRRYEIRSPIAGTILSRDVAEGEVVADRELYVVADLSTVWVDLLLEPSEGSRARAGQSVVVTSETGARAETTVARVAPVAAPEAQAVHVRAVVENRDRAWRPGLFARGEIVVDETEVAVAVPPSALQTFRDWDVVFLNDGDVYQAMPVELGRRDAARVEIVSGMEPGQRYAASGSFVVKADVEKSGATHDH